MTKLVYFYNYNCIKGGIFTEMPVYEYRCTKCETEFEIFKLDNEKNKVICPECGSSFVKKLISNLGFLRHPLQTISKSETKKD